MNFICKLPNEEKRTHDRMNMGWQRHTETRFQYCKIFPTAIEDYSSNLVSPAKRIEMKLE